jgi:hypothetical protein
MGSYGVVVDPPGFDDPACLRQRAEDVFVEAFVAEATIEGLYEGILHWLARRNVVPFDVGLFDPSQHSVAGQLRAIVGDNHRWPTMHTAEPIEFTHWPAPFEVVLPEVWF